MRKEGDDNDSATQSNDQEAETDAFSEAGLSLSLPLARQTDWDLFERQKARNRSAKIDTDHDDGERHGCQCQVTRHQKKWRIFSAKSFLEVRPTLGCSLKQRDEIRNRRQTLCVRLFSLALVEAVDDVADVGHGPWGAESGQAAGKIARRGVASAAR